MFHFPTFPPHALCVQARVTPHDWCGVPPFGNPRINARLTAPRGLSQPPTSFIGSWCQGIHRVPLTTWPHKNPTTPPPEGSDAAGLQELCNYRVRRCSRPLCSSQRTTRHRPPDPARPAPPTGQTAVREQAGPDRDARHPVHPGRSAPSGPNSVPTTATPAPTPFHAPPEGTAVLGARNSRPAELVSVPPSSTTPHTRRPPGWAPSWSGRGSAPPPNEGRRRVLLRKEVIQPHLPVRLPCYDFVPIADPAFDGSLHKGWATGFGRYRLS